MRQPASYTVQKNAELSISHRLFSVFSSVCVAFRIGFYGVFADSRLFALASLDFHLAALPPRGDEGPKGAKERWPQQMAYAPLDQCHLFHAGSFVLCAAW